MCDSGTIDWFMTSENGTCSTCSGPNFPRTTNPGEQVPRIPSVSQAPAGSSVI